MFRTLAASLLLCLSVGCQSCGERPGFFRRLFHCDDDSPSNRAAARPSCAATPAGYLGAPTPPPGSIPACTPVTFEPMGYQEPYQGSVQPLPGPNPGRSDELPQPGTRLPSQGVPLTPGSAAPQPANPNAPGGL